MTRCIRSAPLNVLYMNNIVNHYRNSIIVQREKSINHFCERESRSTHTNTSPHHCSKDTEAQRDREMQGERREAGVVARGAPPSIVVARGLLKHNYVNFCIMRQRGPSISWNICIIAQTVSILRWFNAPIVLYWW